jgi:predicted GIY-YIG superfamily endonuclease
MADCFVYVLSDSSGIRYVGVSVNPDKRVRFHVYEATNEKNKSYHLRKSRWLRSIGFDFMHRVVFFGTEAECYEKEVELIQKLKSKGKRLVNTSKGGDKPPRINELPNFEETRKKISAKSSGRIPSLETRKKMSDAHKANGKPNWFGDVSGYKNPRSRAVVQMDTDGNVLFIWATAKEACDALGTSRSGVTSVIKGYQATCCGFKFDYF